MNSLRARVLWAVLGLLAVAVLLVGSISYRNVRAETEALFDYQLRQMALSLRNQGEIAPAQASALVDEQLDFVVQVWTSDGRAVYATRRHELLLDQLRCFPVGKHDDGPDALEMAVEACDYPAGFLVADSFDGRRLYDSRYADPS